MFKRAGPGRVILPIVLERLTTCYKMLQRVTTCDGASCLSTCYSVILHVQRVMACYNVLERDQSLLLV